MYLQKYCHTDDTDFQIFHVETELLKPFQKLSVSWQFTEGCRL